MAYDIDTGQIYRSPQQPWAEGHIARPGRADIDDLLHSPGPIPEEAVIQAAVTRAMTGKPQLVADQYRARVNRHLESTIN
jgi:hypothetical protein